MMSFRGNYLVQLRLSLASVWLVSDIAEAKGRFHLGQPPEILTALRETALVQSVESSNRIEGVTVAPDRLRPLVLENAQPRDRSEEEIRGYRQALERIHAEAGRARPSRPSSSSGSTPPSRKGAATPDSGSGWTTRSSSFARERPPLVRFRPVKVAETPAAVEELCLLYRHAFNQSLAPPLVAIAALVFDFLCIHPFRDGNGRISRLLTLLALYQHGYEVGRYVSLERLIEESRAEYYDVLHRSSEGWHEGRHDLLPWLNFFLALLKRAYRELERVVERG